MNCPYCGEQAEWVDNKEVYGVSFGRSHMIYLCRKCGAYVGCHNNTRTPLGTMANSELRDWRVGAHNAIDPLWRKGYLTRREVYSILADHFGREIHIAESDIEMCQQIIKFVEDTWKNVG